MKRPRLFLAIFLMLFPFSEGSRAEDVLTSDAIDPGGSRATSATYAIDLSSTPGGAGGSANYTLRSGYAGQIADASAIEILASPPTIDEGGSRQLGSTLIYDDTTTSPLGAGDLSWSVDSGPLSGINAAGLATAAVVYGDSPATVRGIYQNLADTLELTVLNTLPDNFGTYAADGIDDDWQVLYFGVDNPLAASEQDPDGDEQDNRFEFLALVDPTDPKSFFSAELRPGLTSGQTAIVFRPVYPARRTYTVLRSQHLYPSLFTPLAGAPVSDAGGERVVTDQSSGASRRFYKIEISAP